MDSHARVVLRDLGRLLHVPGLMALVTLPLCLFFGEYVAVVPFLSTAIAALAVGQTLYRTFRHAPELRLYDAVVIAALGWLLVPVFGSIPFIWMALELHNVSSGLPAAVDFQDPWNAYFEAVSGFTSTGLTMVLHPSALPRSVQWWRSFMQWVGGVGVIVLVLSVLRPSMGAYHLYFSEAREEKIFPTVSSTVRTIWWIYVLYTLASVLLLKLVGMDWWAALNYGMTGIATGGFGVADHSLGDFGPAIQLALVPIMIAGAVSFSSHYQILREGRVEVLWKDSQHRAFWMFLTAGAAILFLENYWSSGSFFWVDSAFQWTSSLCTAGFQTADLTGWSPTAKLLMSAAMILGGAAGSTVGGIKQIRVVFLYKGLAWRFRRTSRQPHQIVRYELDGKRLTETDADRMVQAAAVLVALWAVTLWLGIFVLIHFVPPGFLLEDVIFEVASAQSNVGMSMGITHPELPWGGKLVLILAMWTGRLEIFPVLFLLSSVFRRSERLASRGVS